MLSTIKIRHLTKTAILIISLGLLLTLPIIERIKPVRQSLRTNQKTASLDTLPPSVKADAAMSARVNQDYGKLPLSFEANTGQVDSRAKFISRGAGYTLFLTSDEAVMSLSRGQGSGARGQGESLASPAPVHQQLTADVLRMKVVGANTRAEVAGRDELEGKVNYFIGNDPAKWRTNISTFKRVHYEEVYPGIDMVYYGNQRQLEYDFKVAPGADPGRIKLSFEGAKKISIDASGELVLETEGGEVRQHQPVIYQEAAGARQQVSGGYVMLSEREVAFELGSYDRSRELVIDPTLVYSTLLGGTFKPFVISGDDVPADIEVDSSGNAYITGSTDSLNFPTTPGAYDRTNTQYYFDQVTPDAFVTKLDPTGSRAIYSTFIGRGGWDGGTSIAVDASGYVYIAGRTTGVPTGVDPCDFPTTPGAFQRTAIAFASFVTKLNQTGSALEYSTYLTGDNDPDTGCCGTYISEIGIDASGNAIVTGVTASPFFPMTTPNCAAGPGAGTRSFVTKFNAAGSALLFSSCFFTYFNSYGLGMAVDAQGYVYLVGPVDASTPFTPTPGAFQATSGGARDLGILKIDTSQSGAASILYATYFGGSGSEDLYGNSDTDNLTVDSSGNIYITGSTSSTNLPTTENAYDRTLNDETSMFVAKINPALSGTAALVYSTYLGVGSTASVAGYGYITDIAIASTGDIWMTGVTTFPNFPVTPDAIQPVHRNPAGYIATVFISKIDPELSGTASLVYSTYYGGFGIGLETSTGIAVDSRGFAYVTGYRYGTNFPTTPGAYQTTVPPPPGYQASGYDGFVLKIDSCTYSLAPTGQTFPAAGGQSSISVTMSGAQSCDWMASSPDDWITITSAPGSGSGQLNYTVAPNTGAELRTGTIIFRDKPIVIHQEGCQVSVSPQSESFTQAGGPGSATITGQGCNWQAFTGDSWISLTPPASGSGSGSLAYTVAANPKAEPRTGAIAIGDTFLIIEQQACPATISPSSQHFDKMAGPGYIDVTSQDCQWNATKTESWIQLEVNSASGTGNGTVSFGVLQNNSAPRTGIITVAGQTFTITQEGCPVSITGAPQSFNAAGGPGTITVQAAQGCNWSVVSAPDWITGYTGGIGNGSTNFTVAANPNAVQRTGAIKLSDQTFTVTQLGCTASISPSTQNFPIAGGTGTVTITSDQCRWQATSNASWISLPFDGGTSGEGNGSVTFTVEQNFEAARTGTLTVAGKTFTVTQDGCQTSINPSSANMIPAAGGMGAVTITAGQGCSWRASSPVAWVNITAGRSGTGNGSSSYSVQKNTQGQPRTATLTIAGKSFTLTQEAAALPVVTLVARQYPGVFLKGTALTNQFVATIDWKGNTPGTVKFQVSGKPPAVATATGNTASHNFNLASDFTPMFSPSVIKITPTTADGLVGQERTEKLYLFDFPKWLEEAINGGYGNLGFQAGGGEIKYCTEAEFPQPHLAADGPIQIPESIPYIGGQFGLTETFGRIKGCVSSNGTGTLTLFGQTGFKAAGGELNGDATGSGQFALGPPNGFNVRFASFGLNLKGTLKKKVGVVEAIPQLAPLANAPVIGRPIKWFNQKAQLEGKVSPSLGFTAAFQQNLATGNLEFKDGTGTLGLDLKATLKVPISDDRLEASAWVGGGGSFTLGVPVQQDSFVRRMEIKFQAGAEFKLDYLISYTGKAVYNAKCTWTPQTGLTCESGGSVEGNGAGKPTNAYLVSLIKADYERFGKYSFFNPVAREKKNSSLVPVTIAETTVATNVFAGASPHLSEVGSGKLLLWAHQDTALPVLQSTDISWSYYNGSSWSTPAVIADDTRAELSPVAGTDATGKVVAAWVRIKDAAFNTPITTAADLPQFYTRLEVVSATFNPATQTWGAITQLTDDAALDTSLRLSSDASGNLMLTWLSNSAGEFTSSAANVSTLMYSFWNGSSWSAPAAIASNLAGVRTHEAAIRGSDAFVILPRDPDFENDSDGVLDLYTWNGKAWSGPVEFAGGGVENRLPAVAYDATGAGHVVWVSGDDLVQATLTNASPATVRAGSNSVSFYETELMINAGGNLTLVWQEGVDEGPANIFARVYDPNGSTWSDDRRLSEDTWLARDARGYYGADGKLNLAYLATNIIRTNQTITFPGGSTTSIPNIPQDGQTDLRLLEHSLATDLAVVDSDLTITPVAPVANDEVTARLVVHNGGDFATGQFEVKLYAGSPESGGVEVGSQTVTAPFAGGGQQQLELTFNYPAIGGNIVAVIDSENAVAEFAESNNRAIVYLTNTAPLARITGSARVGIAPLAVSFDGSTSTDAEGDALTYSWAFGDGSESATGAVVGHTFTQVGVYPVTLAVKDAKGAIGTSVAWVYVGEAFADVPASHSQFADITRMSAQGLIESCAAGAFCPDAPITREQMAVAIIKALGITNPPAPAQQRYSDVPPSNPNYAFIDQIAARQIAAGCSASAFCPTSPVRQDEMAAYLIRALGDFNPAQPAAQRFTDVGAGNPYYAFVEQMWQRRISLGCGCDRYCPESIVTRGQFATLLSRALLEDGGQAGCSFLVCTPTERFGARGGEGAIIVAAFGGCEWQATSSESWLTIISDASGSGSGIVSFLVRDNPGAARQGTINIAGRAVQIVQDGTSSGSCTYTLAPGFASYGPTGGNGAIGVAAGSGCAWQAVSNAGWITITSGSSGIGAGSVNYTVSPNTTGAGRDGKITVAGKTFAIKQK